MVYSLINAARVSCGFGSVSQSTALDQASQAHDYWMLANGYYGHGESSTVPKGYTGVTPYDRDVAAGYSFNATGLQNGEVITGDGSIGNLGASLVSNLLAAPYHSAGVLRGFQNLGIGYMDSNAAGVFSTYGALTYLTVDFGVAGGSTQQLLSGSDVKTYPCEGTTGTALRSPPESPSPVPGRDMTANPVGQAIVVVVRNGQTLALTSATMISVASGAAVPLLAPMDSANDPNKELLGNEGFVLPNSPLATNTSYQVTVNGTNNGVAFSRTFTFTTGV